MEMSIVGIILTVVVVVVGTIMFAIYDRFQNLRPIEHFMEHADHLIVIIHGFHSTPAESHWITSQLLKVIQSEHKKISILRTVPFVPMKNDLWWNNDGCTNDGLFVVVVDRCLDQIYNFVVKHQGSIKKISYIGQSLGLGGLYGREVVQKSKTIPCLSELIPGAFVTLISPNLGCRAQCLGINRSGNWMEEAEERFFFRT